MSNVGVALRRLARHEEALGWFGRALEVTPNMVAALSNRGNVLQELGRIDEALSDLTRATVLDPNNAQAYLNLGFALREVFRNEEALAAYDQAIAIQPDFALAQHDRGQLLLLLGRLDEGFRAIEWRWKDSAIHKEKRRDYPQPVWHGGPVDGRLLVISEQGFGDIIQFSRYVPLLARQGQDVAFEVSAPLYRLFCTSFTQRGVQVCEAAPGGAAGKKSLFRQPGLPPFAAYVGVVSLPDRARTALSTVPGETPYLRVKTRDVRAWRKRMTSARGAMSGNKLEVGFIWQGNPSGGAIMRAPCIRNCCMGWSGWKAFPSTLSRKERPPSGSFRQAR